jgi:hypothetical protein
MNIPLLSCSYCCWLDTISQLTNEKLLTCCKSAAGPRQHSDIWFLVSQDLWLILLCKALGAFISARNFCKALQVHHTFSCDPGSVAVFRRRTGNLQSQSHFTTGDLPPISSSWRQAPWDSRAEISLQLNPGDHNPYVTSSLTQGWVCLLWIASMSKSCYDRRSVGQSVLVSNTNLGLKTRYFFCLTLTGLLMWRALSDERTGLSFVYATGPRQRSLSQVRVLWDSRPYFTVSDFETSLFVASYDSQGHGGGIRPRLHTGNESFRP